MPGHDNYPEINQRIVNLKKDTKIFFNNIEKKGSQSEIFFYQIFDVRKTNRLLLRMVFYEGFEILAMEIKRGQLLTMKIESIINYGKRILSK